MPRKVHVQTTINGEAVEYLCEPRQSLLEVLRDVLHLTGAKEGCNNGNCGACSVILDGRLVNSCLVLGAELEGKSLETIEGLAEPDQLHPIQDAFLENAALQCGICTARLYHGGKGTVRSKSESERTRNPLLVSGQSVSLYRIR